mgnify:CR=1 FL=1
MKKIIPLILAGGSGTRLWPLSQVNKPKQYQLIINNQMLLTQTLNRCKNEIFEKPIISTNKQHKSFIDQIDTQLYDKVIYENVGKNTAASILISCLLTKNQDAYMLVMPSDHYIPNNDYFNFAVKSSMEFIDDFNVITFGIMPKYASDQYGYIQISEDSLMSSVVNFYEKPNISKAQEMLNSGNYLWNSGMFLFQVSKLLDISKEVNISLFEKLYQISSQTNNNTQEINLVSELWSDLINISFDTAIMEKIENIGCFKYEKHWSDLGDWKSIAENSSSDLLIDSENSFVKSYDNNHEIIGIGLRDIVCVVANQKTLCIEKSKLSDIKNILSNTDSLQSVDVNKIYKPWGWYESLVKYPGYQIKILHVNPKGKLSLQSHNRRTEHWIVLDGIAQVQKNNKTFSLSSNESTFIDKNVKHTLWNNESTSLKMIEIQIGDYLEEDDIIRYDDVYDRI